jgi:hypothetical protein
VSKLHECEIDRLHPTQITVGMIEVEDKQTHMEALGHHQRKKYLAEHPIPAVFGPEGKLYIIDHHHMARALWEAKVEAGLFWLEADFSDLHREAFWVEMDTRRWVHPVDKAGKRLAPDALPKHIKGLVDDPYRSLAGYVRNAGGFEKTPTAFAEFLWADFFRRQIRIGSTREEFDTGVRTGIELAHSVAARHLPGFLPSGARTPMPATPAPTATAKH